MTREEEVERCLKLTGEHGERELKECEEGDRWEDDVAGQRFIAGVGVGSEGGEGDHEGCAGPKEVGDGLGEGKKMEQSRQLSVEPKGWKGTHVDDSNAFDHNELQGVPDVENLGENEEKESWVKSRRRGFSAQGTTDLLRESLLPSVELDRLDVAEDLVLIEVEGKDEE